MSASATINHTRAQRIFALCFGIMVHALFAVAVYQMASGLFFGLHGGLGRLTGVTALIVNALLILQFPVLHSWFLSERGRRWLKRAMPLNLGGPLATTSFAGVASVQLSLFFEGWSPLGSTLWTPPPLWHNIFASLFAASWVLLFFAMRETGLSLQSGSLGWWSIWKNRAAAYPPLPVHRPLHRIVRHPIYVAFAFILCTSPSFTTDRMVLALVWTVYCVAGSRLKELRLLRFHGDTYRAYMRRVPFWIPRLRKPGAPEVASNDADVVIIGGGPVGLLLASLLGQQQRRVIVVESSRTASQRSMAIGITPPSLDILRGLGIDRSFIARGVRIRSARVHEQLHTEARLQLDQENDAYPFILSLPQSETVQLLRAQVESCSTARIISGYQAVQMQSSQTGVMVTVRDIDRGQQKILRANFVAGCDGAHSATAALAGIPFDEKTYAPSFVMGDFIDHSGLGDEAHLFFGKERPVESFPLPGGKRRWIVRCGRHDETDLHESIAAAVTRLTGITLQPGDQRDESVFRPRRALAHAFSCGRVALCGDAAHVMSPIGGQGMNTGFGDAAFLARAYDALLDGRGDVSGWMRHYERNRKRAFRIAAARAAAGMSLGVARGAVLSHVRGAFLSAMMRYQRSQRFIARWFTMRSLPAAHHQYDHALRQITGVSITP